MKKVTLLVLILTAFSMRAMDYSGSDSDSDNYPEALREAKFLTSLLFDSLMMDEDEVAIGCIRLGAEVNVQFSCNVTPLHLAAKRGLLDVCICLIGKGARVNVRSSDLYETPLHLATRNRQSEVCLYLLGNEVEIVHDLDFDDWAAENVSFYRSANFFSKVRRHLLRNVAEVNVKDLDDVTPLHLAAKNGLLEVCISLISKGAKVNVRSSNIYETPFYLAAENGHSEVCLLLISKGARVPADCSMLHLVAKNGLLEVCRYLLGNGAEVNAEDLDGDTPLHLAAKGGQLEVCHYLLDNGAKVNGAEVNDENRWGSTPLILAAKKGHSEVCLYLLGKGAEVNAEMVCDNGIVLSFLTPLILAAKNGLSEVCFYLLDKGAAVNAKNNFGYSPLHGAAEGGQLEVCRYLLANGAEVNAVTGLDNRTVPFYLTPLILAAEKGHWEVCLLLIDNGASMDGKSREGIPLLQLAVEGGNSEMCCRLLANGAEVRATDKSGRICCSGKTLLHSAAEHGHLEVCRCLLANGAKVNPESIWLAPLGSAVKNGHRDVCLLLIDNGANVNIETEEGVSLVVDSMMRGDSEMCCRLLENGAEVNAKNRSGQALLHIAAMRGSLGVCRCLLANGAEVNVEVVYSLPIVFNRSFVRLIDGSDLKRPIYVTPLIMAMKDGHREVCLLLIDNGANVNSITEEGVPLAVDSMMRGDSEMCCRLLANGAEVNAKNKSDQTLLHIAVEKGHLEMCCYLLDHGADMNAKNRDGCTPLHMARGHCEELIHLAKGGISIIPFEFRESLSNELSVLEFWGAILPYACLACHINGKENGRLACLKTSLLCMRRVCRNLPRDIKRIIFCYNADRALDYITLLSYGLRQGRVMAGVDMGLLKDMLPDYTIQALKMCLKKYYNESKDPKEKSVLDPETLESNFGKLIRANIHERLEFLQQKALEKDGLNEEL